MAKQMYLSPAEIEERLQEGMRTLAKLPMGRNARPRHSISGWPGVIHNLWEVYNGMTEMEISSRQKEEHDKLFVRFMDNSMEPREVTPDQIERMDEALEWLFSIKDVRQRKAVQAAALGASLRRISKLDGRSAEGIRQALKRTYEMLSARLSRDVAEKSFDRVDRIA